MRILVTNDDGILSPGLFAMKQALGAVGEVAVIAPDKNCSAIGRGITIGQSLDVEEVVLPDGGIGYSVGGTPVDCVRLATLGFLDWLPEIVVSGINLGPNLGDDITYSGTVAAAFEGVLLGIPAIAVSIEGGDEYYFDPVASFTAELSRKIVDNHLPGDILLNINSPNLPPDELNGAEVTHLGKRIYRDQLVEEASEGSPGGRSYHIYGDDPSYHEEEGTDFHAINEKKVSVTPIHFALTDLTGLKTIGEWDLDEMLGMPGRKG